MQIQLPGRRSLGLQGGIDKRNLCVTDARGVRWGVWMIQEIPNINWLAVLVAAILRYEPRILQRTLKVRVSDGSVAGGSPNTVVLEIEGQLWAQPLPEALFIRTKVDLETGHFSLEER